MKKIGLFSLFGILFLSLTGCMEEGNIQGDIENQGQNQEENQQQNQETLTYQYHNDFKDLDRTLIPWTLNFKECEEKFGSTTKESSSDYRLTVCNDGFQEQKQYNYLNNIRIPSDYHSINDYNEDIYTFNLDRKKNDQLTAIFDKVNMPVEYQNSLIELFALTGEQITYKNINDVPRACEHRVCFDQNTPIQFYKGRYYQKTLQDSQSIEMDGEKDEILLYQEDLNLRILYTTSFEGEHIDFFIDNTNESVEMERNDYCLHKEIQQKENKKSDFQIPETLTFFGETYQLQALQNTINVDLTTSNEYGYVEIIKDLFKNPEEAEKIITNSIIKTNQIYNTYLLKFEQYPNLFFAYSNTTQTQNAQAILKSDESFNLDEKGNLMDINQTISVLCNLGLNDFNGECKRAEGEYDIPRTILPLFFFDEQKGKTIDYKRGEYSRDDKAILNQKMLPLFRVEESANKGYYYIFPAEGVIFDAGGAGCKPVIYVYDKFSRENSVSVTLPEFARFTKVIPDFSSFPTWKFISNAQSEIKVNKEIYPYLYYSILWKDYQDNHYGWTVAYEDIPGFLENKLDYMNFSEKEKADFLEYWLPEFQPGFVYSISFKFNDAFEPYAKLDFAIEPQHLFRMFMEAHQLPLGTSITYSSEKPETWNQILLEKAERNGEIFAIERGGKLDKWTK